MIPRPTELDDALLNEWVAWLERNRRDHESLVDASRRLLVTMALASFQNHHCQLDKAAEMLSLRGPTVGARRSQVCRWAKQYGINRAKLRARTVSELPQK